MQNHIAKSKSTRRGLAVEVPLALGECSYPEGECSPTEKRKPQPLSYQRQIFQRTISILPLLQRHPPLQCASNSPMKEAKWWLWLPLTVAKSFLSCASLTLTIHNTVLLCLVPPVYQSEFFLPQRSFHSGMLSIHTHNTVFFSTSGRDPLLCSLLCLACSQSWLTEWRTKGSLNTETPTCSRSQAHWW